MRYTFIALLTVLALGMEIPAVTAAEPEVIEAVKEDLVLKTWPLKEEDQEKLRDAKAVVVGAGISGILTALRLQTAEIPTVLIDRSVRVGGAAS